MIYVHQSWQTDPISGARNRCLYAANNVRRPLLLVNCEARAAALSAYLPAFYNKSNNQIVHLNPQVDTVHIDGGLVNLLAKYSVARWIQKIAFPIEDWIVIRSDLRPPEMTIGAVGDRMRILCGQMRALKEVQIVTYDQEKWGWCESGPFGNRKGYAEINDSRNVFSRSLIRICSPSIGDFRRILAATRREMGLSDLQGSVVVRAIAVGKSVIDPCIIRDLELV
jgi:hypothetical protein